MNIKSIIQIAIIISLFLMLLPVSPSAENIKISQTSHVVINEVCWNVTNPMAWWFELYNPTTEPINVTGWRIWFLSVDGPIDFSSLIIPSDGYAVVCRNIDNFSEYWAVPDYVEIAETHYDSWGCINDSFSIYNGSKRVDTVGQDNDYIFLPTLHLNHSWARYKGGYDTDNFTNDFYDESDPTPGWENRISKHSPTPVISSPTEGDTFLITDNIFFDGSNSSDPDNEPFSFYWVSNISGYLGSDQNFTASLVEGKHRIILWVNDNSGHNVSASVDITVKANQKPMVAISTPSDGSTVKGKITIAGATNDPDGVIEKVWIKIDSESWAEASGTWSWSYTWDTTKVSDGEHTISVRAFDGYDYSTIETVTVNVNNKKETPNGFIPGFEMFILIIALAGCIILLKHRKRLQ